MLLFDEGEMVRLAITILVKFLRKLEVPVQPPHVPLNLTLRWKSSYLSAEEDRVGAWFIGRAGELLRRF